MRSRSPVRHAARSACVAALVATLAVALTGCGQKGALYLPDRGGEVVTRPQQTPAETPEDESGPGANPPKPTTEPPR
jgi:predicted small lipoprotein YifL